jgi:hypothetical protein
MDTKLTESLRKKRKERKREHVMLDFYWMLAKDLIGVLNIDLVFWGDEDGIKPCILEINKFIFQV